ncbi:hypothetical protein Q5H91_13800 [Sphingomonas sp. KR1UV-12]|uniref:Secreted protein n=1 Tax=Sphingomonas aurea TaxID=3063994 RepID=A0ABT9EMW2_9SPHN|nr:hypothetical protein [Sphingomonas sp. KR1UV-12]MDP1028294.1 hypothetical protein [Sphingomonas sp. KR1UV-12]
MIAALLLAVQAAATPLPSAGQPPQRIYLTNCPQPVGDEIVVCGAPETQRLPLPDDSGPPDRPMPSNPEVTGIGALAAADPVCAARQGGCQVGVDLFGMGTAAVRLVGKLIDPDSCCDTPGEATNVGALIGDVAKAFRKKPDKTGRIAIALDAPPPSTAGRLSP